MYLSEYADRIRRLVPAELLPADDTEDLFRSYAVLLLAKGSEVTLPDVHNAWAGWMSGRNPDHPSLVPFEKLAPETARQDEPFLTAIQKVAAERAGGVDLDAYLFPNGLPGSDADRALTYEQYKVMVASSEAMVSRRQSANAFFLTLNGALLTAIALIVGQKSDQQWQAAGLLVLSVAGLALSQAWISLIHSFTRLNAAKFAVINRLERLFPAAVFLAEWKTLDEGRNPRRYRLFTAREIWVPYLATAVYAIAAVVELLVVTNLWSPS